MSPAIDISQRGDGKWNVWFEKRYPKTDLVYWVILGVTHTEHGAKSLRRAYGKFLAERAKRRWKGRRK